MPTLRTTAHGRIYTRDRSSKLWVRFQGPDGREVRKSAGTTELTVAEKVLEEEYHAARELTFRAAVVDFFEVQEGVLKGSTLSTYRGILRTVDPYFGHKSLARITLDDLKVFVGIRRRQVQPGTVRLDLAFISTIFTHAIENLVGGPSSNPVTLLPRRSLRATSRTRWLTAGEYERALEACTKEMHRHILTLATHTGMRSGELKGLRKGMIDWGRHEVTLPARLNKNGKSRSIPLNPHSFRTLQEVCSDAPGDLVLWHDKNNPTPYANFDRMWRIIRRKADLEDVHFHDLRHTFASWWVQQGGNIYALKNILGHASLAMVERYAHLDTGAAHREMRKIFPHTFGTLTEDTERTTEPTA